MRISITVLLVVDDYYEDVDRSKFADFSDKFSTTDCPVLDLYKGLSFRDRIADDHAV